jgi:hypothetical protein
LQSVEHVVLRSQQVGVAYNSHLMDRQSFRIYCATWISRQSQTSGASLREGMQQRLAERTTRREVALANARGPRPIFNYNLTPAQVYGSTCLLKLGRAHLLVNNFSNCWINSTTFTQGRPINNSTCSSHSHPDQRTTRNKNLQPSSLTANRHRKTPTSQTYKHPQHHVQGRDPPAIPNDHSSYWCT